jgi:hypothetical protein
LLARLPGHSWCDNCNHSRRFLPACHLELVQLAEKRPVTPAQPAKNFIAERREIFW